MRMLSEAELDVVFGGGDSTATATTLAPVVVTEKRITSNSGDFLSGWSDFRQDETWSSGSSNYGCYAGGTYPALSPNSIPTPPGLECMLAATAAPGKGLPAGVSVHVVNNFAFRETTQGDPNIGGYAFSSSPTIPGNYDVMINGTFVGSNLYIYARGMIASQDSSSYVDPVDGMERPNGIGSLTARENALLTFAHEAAHANGISNEADATSYGKHAVERFRAGAGTSCPR